MTATHLEHEIAASPGSPGRGGLESPVGHPSRIETIPAENVRRFSAAAATDIARRAPGHPRTHRSTTATAMPALQKMDLQRKAA